MYTQRLIFVFLRLFITLVYSHIVLGFLFMVPERSICGDSLLECFVLGFFVVVVFFALFSALGGSTGLLMAAQLVFLVHLSLRGF